MTVHIGLCVNNQYLKDVYIHELLFCNKISSKGLCNDDVYNSAYTLNNVCVCIYLRFCNLKKKNPDKRLNINKVREQIRNIVHDMFLFSRFLFVFTNICFL